jgi:hypothetical protein
MVVKRMKITSVDWPDQQVPRLAGAKGTQKRYKFSQVARGLITCKRGHSSKRSGTCVSLVSVAQRPKPGLYIYTSVKAAE